MGYGGLAAIRNLCFGLCLSAGFASGEPVVVAALGDSLTQGYGLAQNDGLIPQLRAWLEAQGAEVELRNAGVSGDTTRGGLARVDWTLTPDVDAMMVILGGNDALRGIDPAEVRGNLDGIVARGLAADVEILLVGMRAPQNFGPAYKAEFDAIHGELAAAHGVQFVQDFFAPFAEGDGFDRSLFQPDGIHPNAAGVLRVVDHLGPALVKLAQSVNE